MANGNVFAEVDAPLLLHPVQHAVVLDVGIGPDTDLVHIPTHDGVHPDRCMLTQHDVANNLRRLIDVTTGGNRWLDAFVGSNQVRTRFIAETETKTLNIPDFAPRVL